MSARGLAALISLGPSSDGTNTTGELRFTSSNVAAANNLPAKFSGRMVEITNESTTVGDFIAVLFTFQAVTITLGAAAADGGPAVGRGRVIMPGTTRRMRVPSPNEQAGPVIFNRIAAANTPVISVALVE